MPPKRVPVAPATVPSRAGNEGFLTSAYRQLTASENATIVRSILVFGAAVAFLHSSLGEVLIPPL